MSRLLPLLGAAIVLPSALCAQYVVESIPPNFVDIALTGQPTGLAGQEDQGTQVPLGFVFELYDESVANLAVTTNGYLTTGADLTDFNEDCPAPDPTQPNGLIAPFFDDLSLVGTGEIFTQTLGTAPDRSFVCQWNQVTSVTAPGSSLTFQARLFEADGRIEFHYQTLDDPNGLFAEDGSSAFVGIENSTGTEAVVIGCGDAILSTTSAWAIRPVLPFIEAPELVAGGDLVTVRGLATPLHVYVYAWARNPGPIGPIPLLENATLDLALNFKLAGSGLVPADGATLSNTFPIPFGVQGAEVYWQMITIGNFNPIAEVGVSNSERILVTDEVTFTGSLPVPNVADHYTCPLTAGELVTIRHCRTDNTGGSGSTLDNYLCLVDPSGTVVAADDDSAGDCFVDGPFGASQITNFVVPTTGVYTIYASSYQALSGGQIGDYELTIRALQATNAVLAFDDGPVCAGQP